MSDSGIVPPLPYVPDHVGWTRKRAKAHAASAASSPFGEEFESKKKSTSCITCPSAAECICGTQQRVTLGQGGRRRKIAPPGSSSSGRALKYQKLELTSSAVDADETQLPPSGSIPPLELETQQQMDQEEEDSSSKAVGEEEEKKVPELVLQFPPLWSGTANGVGAMVPALPGDRLSEISLMIGEMREAMHDATTLLLDAYSLATSEMQNVAKREFDHLMDDDSGVAYQDGMLTRKAMTEKVRILLWYMRPVCSRLDKVALGCGVLRVDGADGTDDRDSIVSQAASRYRRLFYAPGVQGRRALADVRNAIKHARSQLSDEHLLSEKAKHYVSRIDEIGLDAMIGELWAFVVEPLWYSRVR